MLYIDFFFFHTFEVTSYAHVYKISFWALHSYHTLCTVLLYVNMMSLQCPTLTMHTEYCVSLCYFKEGHSLPWSQPSLIHRWIVVINLRANGSRQSTWTPAQTLTDCPFSDPVSVSDGDEQKYCLSSPLLRTGCHPQTARSMCL